MSFKKIGAACLLGGAFVLASVSAQAAVFINEIHYDDAETPTAGDQNEAVEVVATNGEDLSLYDLVLYNGGSNGTAAVTYDTDAIPVGAIVACGSNVRVGVVNYFPSPAQLQNGSFDGIALVRRSDSAVMQFLSYEGVATASNGPANGTSSINIPVSEGSSTQEGTSLQLTGTGAAYANFTWAASATSTFGACNNNQVFNLGTPANVLPTVVTTNPLNGGTVDSGPRAFQIEFSEPVTLTGSGVSLVCNTAGNVGLTPSPRTDIPEASRSFISAQNMLTGDSCILTFFASEISDVEGAHPLGNTVVNFTVVVAPPLAPSVSETFLSNGIPQTRTANYFIRFSEAVTLTSNAFTLQCSVSGSVTMNFPTSGIDYTIDPTVNLQNGETCVFTAHASEITDADNMHPPMDFVVTFPIAPQAGTQPQVVSTTPAHNAVGVPTATEIRVVFSEMVKADSETFVLQCTASGLIANLLQYKQLETVAGGGRAITLASPVLLQPGETCTLTVIAQGVVDNDSQTMSQDKVVSFKIAGGNVSTYYNPVNTSSAEQLRCSLHSVIRGHTVYPYSAGTTDTWDILEIADEDPNNSGHILDVYKNRSYVKGSDRAGTGSGVTYNREHTWPNSLGFGTDTGNLGLPHAPYTDTHMLYLSDTQYNADRGNDPYGNCTLASGCGERATEVNNGNGGGTGVYPGNSNWTNGSRFETWSKRKGDVARAVMYMAIRYEGGTHTVTGQNEPDLELTDNAALIVGTSSSPAYMGLVSDLLAWHQADPPDAAELARNEVIFNFQGNRNPFIDHPEWATAALFSSAKPASCTLGPASFNQLKRTRPLPTPKPPRHNIH